MAEFMGDDSNSGGGPAILAPKLCRTEIRIQPETIQDHVFKVRGSGLRHAPVVGPYSILGASLGLVVACVNVHHKIQDPIRVPVINGEIHIRIQLGAGFGKRPVGGGIGPDSVLNYVTAIVCAVFCEGNRAENVKNGSECAKGIVPEIIPHRPRCHSFRITFGI